MKEALPNSVGNDFVEMVEAVAVDGWFRDIFCLKLWDSKAKTMRVAVRVFWTTNLPDGTSNNGGGLSLGSTPAAGTRRRRRTPMAAEPRAYCWRWQ